MCCHAWGTCKLLSHFWSRGLWWVFTGCKFVRFFGFLGWRKLLKIRLVRNPATNENKNEIKFPKSELPPTSKLVDDFSFRVLFSPALASLTQFSSTPISGGSGHFRKVMAGQIFVSSVSAEFISLNLSLLSIVFYLRFIAFAEFPGKLKN